ncbi:transketolase [Schnuerera ultunensis]|uniref:Putative transketolase N-terminal section n=1 Tax=[Clostridium] ultunense Esp TaxID=1288971 RepID=A0A1M4PL73_9FIRM|nr:transketolase [Schnuerera ultunensis]SHD76200.1 putative transketolase N-terminal section [[Clostridium] ultunense Esp]
MEIKILEGKCKELRGTVLKMINKASSGHPGGSLSMMEIIIALYYQKMRINPENPYDNSRDRFVLSKGHAAPALYAVLADKGYFSKDILDTFRAFNSPLQGHPDKKKLKGVDASTGSLGQGVSIATGMALGAKILNNDVKVYTVLGDGELQEGQVWEAAMAAAHYKLDNLTVIIDNNRLQIDGSTEEVMDVGNIASKYKAFGFEVIEVEDGNDIREILEALDVEVKGKPKCIIAHTIKGKGVSFMENQVGWHGKALNDEELKMALDELGWEG